MAPTHGRFWISVRRIDLMLRHNLFSVAIVFLAVAACSKTEVPETVVEDTRSRDFFSFANTDKFITKHLVLDLTVDFDAEQLYGSATLQLQQLDTDATKIILDTRDLTIEGARFLTPSGEPVNAEHRFGATEAILGTPLIISIPEEVQSAAELILRIDYHTSPASTALQWLPPELTAGGEYPFLFSQSQTIHARSWVPLQDTPAVRITYGATIRTPPALLAVMSADNDPAAARDGNPYPRICLPSRSAISTLRLSASRPASIQNRRC
jgi:aminopeptidase N